MKTAIFTESILHLTPNRRVYSPICRFIQFIAPLSEKLEMLTIVSRSKMNMTPSEKVEYLDIGERRSFIRLPYYNSTEDFYKRALFLIPRCIPVIKQVISLSDVIVVRIHHPMAWIIARITASYNKPLVLYWAGPPLTELAKKNYPGSSIRNRAARMIAMINEKGYRRLIRSTAMNLFIDKREYELMGSPDEVHWIVPTLVSENVIVKRIKPRKDSFLKVIFAGRIFRHKGIYELVEAVKRMRQFKVPVKLIVAGDGPEKTNVERMVKQNKLTEHIDLKGNISHKAVQRLIQDSHIMALPSHAEGLPKILWEAWAGGLAVVISDVGSIGKYVNNNNNGFLVTPGNVKELTEALLKLFKDEDLRMTFAIRGCQLVKQHTWEKEIEKIYLLMKEAVKARGENDINLKGIQKK